MIGPAGQVRIPEGQMPRPEDDCAALSALWLGCAALQLQGRMPRPESDCAATPDK